MKHIKFITHLQPYIPNGYQTQITDEDEKGIYFDCPDKVTIYMTYNQIKNLAYIIDDEKKEERESKEVKLKEEIERKVEDE